MGVIGEVCLSNERFKGLIGFFSHFVPIVNLNYLKFFCWYFLAPVNISRFLDGRFTEDMVVDRVDEVAKLKWFGDVVDDSNLD